MFLENKYKNWYFSIITRAQNRKLKKPTYFEQHHIIPSSIGGSNDKTNKVRLTAKEHFICHLLLPKMIEDSKLRGKMYYALLCIMRMATKSQKRQKITSGVLYEQAKHQAALYNSTIQKGKTPWNKGIPMTDEAKQNLSNSIKGKEIWNKGVPATEERKQNMRDYYNTEEGMKARERISKEQGGKFGEANNFYGKKHDADTRKRMSENSQNKTNRHRMKEIIYDGVSYPSMGIASQITGISLYILRKHQRLTANEFINIR